MQSALLPLGSRHLSEVTGICYSASAASGACALVARGLRVRGATFVLKQMETQRKKHCRHLRKDPYVGTTERDYGVRIRVRRC